MSLSQPDTALESSKLFQIHVHFSNFFMVCAYLTLSASPKFAVVENLGVVVFVANLFGVCSILH